jgi:hypothetical protein
MAAGVLLLTPVATFELIAMVAKSAHIPGSRFTRLPNPCADTPPHQLNTAACLNEFAARIKACPDLGDHMLTEEIKSFIQRGRFDGMILGQLDGMISLDTKTRRTLEQLVDNYIMAHTKLENEKAGKNFTPADPESQATMKEEAEKARNDAFVYLLDSLHKAVDLVDQNLMHKETQDEIRDVISKHFDTMADKHSELEEKLGQDGSKEKNLVAFYFDEIRPTVVRVDTGSASTEPLTETEMKRSAIWLGLMFRMWSWLFLHTFNPLDRMIERTEFQNNRLPVYIG